jgi:predicted transcriptional regulator
VIKHRAPKKVSLSDQIEKAKELKRQDLSLGQIATLMGVTKPTIKNWLEGYPYKRKPRQQI